MAFKRLAILNAIMSKIVLNLGCGKTRLPNSIGVDSVKIEDYVDVVHDLNTLPYPFKDNYADEVHLYHVLEHLANPLKKLEEIHRILKIGGKAYIRVPHFSSMGAFTDLTHIRPFGIMSFNCLQKDDYHHFYTKVEYKVLHREIRYLGLYPNNGFYGKYIHPNQCPKILRPFILVLNFFINLSPYLFERVWCYYVGGATEVFVILEKR